MKTTMKYWNALLPENFAAWTPIEASQGNLWYITLAHALCQGTIHG